MLADLQSCLYYYENVAESDGDVGREQEIKANKKRLAKIIGKIQQEATCKTDYFDSNWSGNSSWCSALQR